MGIISKISGIFMLGKSDKGEKIKQSLADYRLKMVNLNQKALDAWKRAIGRVDERKLAELRKKFNK